MSDLQIDIVEMLEKGTHLISREKTGKLKVAQSAPNKR